MIRKVLLSVLLAIVSFSTGAWAEEGKVGETKFAVPPSIMLHAHSVEFLPKFLDLIEKEGYTTTTYREFGQLILAGRPIEKKYIIISIDDYGPYRVINVLRTMAEEIEKRGMVAVLSLVPVGLDQDSWEFLASMQKAGFEIASHTCTHRYLPGLSEKDLKAEIAGSYNLIAEHLESPVSLVLPYGGFGDDQRILRIAKESGYEFAVGIAGGEEIGNSPVFYVGRGSPNLRSPEKTLLVLETRFGIFTETGSVLTALNLAKEKMK